MSGYKYSTQAKYWLFTMEKVEELLHQRYNTTIERIENLYNQLANTPTDTQTKTTTTTTHTSTIIGPPTSTSTSSSSSSSSSSSLTSTLNTNITTPVMGMKRRRPDDDEEEHTKDTSVHSKRGRDDTSSSSTSTSSSLHHHPRYYVPYNHENYLLQWFGRTIFSICYNHSNFDPAIACTAVVYLQRYYLYHTFIDYSPSELMMAAILLAIKTESCPYTEVTPFTQLLSIIDKEWFILLDYTLLHYTPNESTTVLSTLTDRDGGGSSSSSSSGPLSSVPSSKGDDAEQKKENNAKTTDTTTTTNDDDDNDDVDKEQYYSHTITNAYSHSSTDTSMLRNEIPLVTGIHFHLQIHHPHSIAKALLMDCIQMYVQVVESQGSSPSPTLGIPNKLDSHNTVVHPDTETDEFRTVWNHYQERVMSLCDLICTTSCIFYATPAQLALASLIVAGSNHCTPSLSFPSNTSSTSTTNATTIIISSNRCTEDQPKDNDTIFREFVQYVTPEKRFETLHRKPSDKLTWYIPYFIQSVKQKYSTNPLSSRSSSSSSTILSTTTDTILNACVSSLETAVQLSSSELTRTVLASLQCIQPYKDLSYRPGTSAYQLRLQTVKKAKELYMRTKYSRGKEATKTFITITSTAQLKRTENTSLMINNNSSLSTTTVQNNIEIEFES